MASSPRYDEDFKKSLVALFNNGKTQTALSKEYGVSLSALGRGKPHLKKSDCHFHATLRQRLDAIYKLRFQHNIKTQIGRAHV